MFQICKTDQTCGVDPEGLWTVFPYGASITPTNNGTNWDADGSAPDVFIVAKCPGATASVRSTTIQSYDPMWPFTWPPPGSCTARAADLMSAQWTFQVFDEDFSVHDTITGSLGYTFTEANLLYGEVIFAPVAGLRSLSVVIAKNP